MRSLLHQSLLNQFSLKKEAEEVVDGKHERHSIESLHSSNCDTCTIRTEEGYDSSSSDESEESGTFLTGGGDPSNQQNQGDTIYHEWRVIETVLVSYQLTPAALEIILSLNN